MSDSVPAIERAVRILNALKDGPSEYGVSELSKSLEINKSTVHGIVRTLSKHRMLEQDPNTRKYRLGPGLIELGGVARAGRDLRQVAHPFLVKLTERIGETVLLGVFEDDGITIIDRVEPGGEYHITASSGQRLPFAAGSFGRAFLAWMTDDQVDRLLTTHGLNRYTETTTTDLERFKDALRKVRQQGYSVDDREQYLQGVWAVSAPIHGPEGILAVLTLVGFSGRMTESQKQIAISAVTEAARQISLGMGAPAASWETGG